MINRKDVINAANWCIRGERCASCVYNQSHGNGKCLDGIIEDLRDHLVKADADRETYKAMFEAYMRAYNEIVEERDRLKRDLDECYGIIKERMFDR